MAIRKPAPPTFLQRPGDAGLALRWRWQREGERSRLQPAPPAAEPTPHAYRAMTLAELLHEAASQLPARCRGLADELRRHAASRCACFECRSGKHGPL